MKILITTELYLPTINGVVTSVVNLKTELIKLGHDVKILTLSNDSHSFKKDEVIYISSIGAGKIYPGARLSLIKENKYIQELMNWHPDIIHTQSEFSTFFMAKHIANKLNIPIIHTYHTVYENYTHYFSPVKSWGKVIVAQFTRRILKQTEGVIAPSHKVQTLLYNYDVKQKIFVIPTGINIPKLINDNNDKLINLKHSLSIPNDKKVLLFVGRLAKEKNLEEIFNFYSKLDRTNLMLLIVGDGPNRVPLESLAVNLSIDKEVRFTGMIARELINDYYRIGDVFISASNSETQGLTYIEALSNSIPIICRKDDCLDEVIVDGMNGWQYENFQQFQNQLDITLGEQNKAYKQNAFNSVMLRYSSSVFAKQIEAAYIQTIEYYLEKHHNVDLTTLGTNNIKVPILTFSLNK
ncbi:MAG: glycosyltransferase family 4 protein [Spirochaetaceae bacterium]|nr:glycosyltransferase family 4 protein [Spirochaetaceae bacterium]